MIALWLRAAGHRVFLDHDLEVGDAWAKRLFEELYQADALVAVVTAAFGQSQWCTAEVGIALANGVRLLPVRAEPGASHRLIAEDIQWTALDSASATARADLLNVLRAMDGADGTAWSAAPVIYPGLDAFTAGQARVFFGRDHESRQLAERLRAPARPADRGLLAVVGPSGSGKSSLVRAGLVPRLAADRGWLALPALVPAASPAANPVGELVRLLAAAGRHRGFDWTVGQVAQDLARPGGITRLAAELLADAAPARQLLLVIDQAEELLDPATPQPQRRQFASLLLEATGGPVRAVATIRTEFLDPLSVLAADTGLPVTTFLVRPLARDMLSLVITGPARRAGISVSDELVARMVTDTGGGEALPLLAYVLNQLAIGVTCGGELSAERYDALGGVHGALTRQADAALADAALADAAAATGRSPADVLAGLLCLVTINDDGQLTRRRANLASLPSDIRTEMEVFVSQRLLTIHQPDAPSDSGGPVIDIAHEQILTAWQPFADAVTAAADTLRLQADLTDAATAWDRDNRPSSHLWELDRSRRAARGLNLDDLSRTAREFLTASHHHGQSRRLRATAILTVLLLLVTAGGITALIQRNRAVAEREQAVQRERHLSARMLVRQAGQLRSRDIVQALRLGLAAEALAPSEESLASLEATLSAIPENGGRLRLWDVFDLSNPAPIATPIEDNQNFSAVAFSPNGRTLATITWLGLAGSSSGGHDSGRLRLWDVSNPRNPASLASINDDQDVSAVGFSPDGRTLATTTSLSDRDGGRLQLWDVSNPRNPASLASINDDQNVDAVAFSPDGRTLATTTSLSDRDGGRLRLWDVSNPRTPRASIDDDQNVSTVAFSSDGRTLATTSWLSHRDGGPSILPDIDRDVDRHSQVLGLACAAAGRGLSEEEWRVAVPEIPYRDSC